MIRTVTSDPGALREADLPPRGPRAQTRVLFLTFGRMGFATLGRYLERYSASRGELDAVHVKMLPTPAMTAAGVSFPGLKRSSWDFHNHRNMAMWGARVRAWLNGPLDWRRFDVIHVTTQHFASGVASVLEDVKDGPRFIVQIDATGPLMARGLGMAPLPARLLERAERRVFERADVIECWSGWALGSVRDDFGLGSRAVLARPGLELSSPPPGLDTEGGRTPGSDTPRLVWVGLNWARKGGPRLLRWHQERWASRGVELHVIGMNAGDARGTRVFAHGPVPHDELIRDHLRPGDIFVMPTEKDTLLLAAIEASSRGLAVVTSDMAGLRESVLHERTGLLCPVRDDGAFIGAIERLLTDHDLRWKLGREGVRYTRAEWDAAKWYPKLMERLSSREPKRQSNAEKK
ncbi:MAG: glycosyltransferase family 4 protein [Phycisphaerales bacterium]|nr:glycosyltransferase family 4 protein [Phycisphaerales bacterium]